MVRYLRYILFLVVSLPVMLFAQSKVSQPSLQTIDDGFFDPTRKPEKIATPYTFGVEYRIEAGYIQNEQRSTNDTYPHTFLHGARIGATFNFLLPHSFSLQTGLFYSLGYGVNEQHWRSMNDNTTQEEYLTHRILEHNLIVPVRAYYNILLWRELKMFFYGGAQVQVGLAQTDYIKQHLSNDVAEWLQQKELPTSTYDKMTNELYRPNIQLGVGGGFDWGRYRLQAGYDFGLNNLIRQKKADSQQMWEWGWYVSFGYRF